ncbi:hypothetical protein RDI61_29010, partial [Pseudomonas plecoglossicida]|uniref:hypothetical protein n=1 Tax=Pseudomonas plecoglossicida TaxID=70775 RepID=UPI002806F8A7
ILSLASDKTIKPIPSKLTPFIMNIATISRKFKLLIFNEMKTISIYTNSKKISRINNKLILSINTFTGFSAKKLKNAIAKKVNNIDEKYIINAKYFCMFFLSNSR